MHLHTFFSLPRRAVRSSGGSGRSRRRSGVELLEDRVLLSVLNVTDTGDSASDTGSLRNAILNAQNGDTIAFDIPTSDPGYDSTTSSWTIEPSSPLPAITNSILIDGFSQPGYSGTPVITLSGNDAGTASGLTISGSGVTIRGLDVTAFSQGAGVRISGSGATANWVYGSFLGTDPTGTLAAPNDAGVEIDGGASGNLIGTNGDGANDASERNVLSGNLFAGAWILGSDTEHNVVAGNLIGTDESGTLGVSNGYGVYVDMAASFNLIGTSGQDGPIEDALERNVISGNTNSGVTVVHASLGNVIAGNYIGTTAFGTATAGNGVYGVYIGAGSQGNWVGVNPVDAVETADQRNIISGNRQFGVIITGTLTTDNTVAGNYVGTDYTGTAAVPNYAGIYIQNQAHGNLIGTNGDGVSDSLERNIISGNQQAGVWLNFAGSNNIVAGNFVGTDSTGESALGDGAVGVWITSQSSGNWIGVNAVAGPENADEGNVISGNPIAGVDINGAGADDDTVAGNYIGTDYTGTAAIPNYVGVDIETGASGNLVGTNGDGIGDALERNILSGNLLAGVWMWGTGTDNNVVAGNFIGATVTGDTALGNGSEIAIYPLGPVYGYAIGGGVVITGGAANNLVGTSGQSADDAGERNIISGDPRNDEIDIFGSASGNVVAGNFIGTNAEGTAALGSAGDGVFLGEVNSTNWVGVNTVYGPANADEGNVISGNAYGGLQIGDSSNQVAAGNLIGTNAAGTAAVPNGFGVQIVGSTDNLIGTTGQDGSVDAIERNVISGNAGVGLWITYIANGPPPVSTANVVAGNDIGTDEAGTAALPNATNGVQIDGGAYGNWIGVNSVYGPESADQSNIIAFNNGDGVAVGLNATDASTGNSLLSNAIYANTALGIDLGSDGVTPDHSTPTTGIIAGAPNGLENFPVLSLATFVPDSSDSDGTMTVAGTLEADPGSTYTIQFFLNAVADPSGYGQGQVLVGSQSVGTDGSGNASFTVEFTTADVAGESISATATDPSGNTSEFGDAIFVVGGSGTTLDVPIGVDQTTTQTELQGVLAELQNLPSGMTQPTVLLQPASAEQLDSVASAIGALAPWAGQSAPSVTITVDLGGQTYQTDPTFNPPSGVQVVIENGTLKGDSPALTIEGGSVALYGVVALNNTSAPTILVEGGSLFVRNSTINGSTVPGEAAISITGGSVDLGTSSSPGGNMINITAGDEFVHDTTGMPVPTVGDNFTVAGTVQTAAVLSFTQLTSAPETSVFGQKVKFTATVVPDNPGGPVPTGPVTFVDETTGMTLGTANLHGGTATLSTGALGVGSHHVIASYSGSSTFLLSLDQTTQVVTPSSTATALASSPGARVFGQPVTLTAIVTAVTPGSGTPTGTVAFYDGMISLGAVSLTGGKAALKTSSVAVGSQSITAVYQGDPNFGMSTSSNLTLQVNQDGTASRVASSAKSNVYGQTVTFTATVTAAAPGSGTPTGTVNFDDAGTPIGVGTLSGGIATFSTAFFVLGSHSITVSYGGDSNFTGSSSTALSQTVNQAGSSTVVSVAPDSSVYGQSLLLKATVSASSPASGTPTGTVKFTQGSTVLGSGTLTNGAVSIMSSVAIPFGADTIRAAYSGDANFKASAGTASETVGQDSTSTAVLSSANPSVFGQSVSFTATVSVNGPGSGTPTGTVTFMDGVTKLATVALGGGSAKYSTAKLATGSHAITATYNGASSFNISSGSLTQTVNQNEAVAVVASSLDPSAPGQKVNAIAIGTTSFATDAILGTLIGDDPDHSQIHDVAIERVLARRRR